MEIKGVVSNIVYKNEENGYCVAGVELDDGGETVIVGTMPFLGVSEEIWAQGSYVNHPEYGMQFSVVVFERKMPSDLKGICDYLSSRVIKGIGPKTARQLVDTFGRETFDVIAHMPEKLTQIRGISREKAYEISDSFNRQNVMQMILNFLLQHQLPMAFAAGLYKEFGENAIKIISADPYVLCWERFGLDFHVADEVAKVLEIRDNDPVRLKAALVYELTFNLGSGHIFIPEDKLLEITHKLCGADFTELRREIDQLYENGELVRDTVAEKPVCYLRNYHGYEDFVAQSIVRLAKMVIQSPPDFDKVCKRVQANLSMTFAAEQIEALKAPFENALTVITGGPGTGKTTTILGLMELFDHYKMSVCLAAPTGRAAKRMTELCGREAKTLHRLLEAGYSREDGVMRFKRNLENPIETDILIIDEASMVDMKLAAAVFFALKHHTRVILVGDKDQLPPVGSGNFFKDLIESKYVPSVALTYIFRQGQDSRIVTNAHLINQGQYPDLATNKGDFYFAAVKSGQSATSNIVSLMCQRIPKTFGIPSSDIQVISPTRQMSCGTFALNRLLQNELNPSSAFVPEIRFGSVIFREGDRVMQIKNNYDVIWVKSDTGEAGSGIFNGDAGVITKLDKQGGMMVVLFDDSREAAYTLDELDQLEHAYAITVHKAQGSEYDAVILPLFEMPQRLANRSILYTAVTRAKKLLIIVGSPEVVAQMVDINSKNKRYGALKSRIRRYYGQ